MFDGGYVGSVREREEVQTIARKLGLEVTLHEFRRAEDFASIFDVIKASADAVYVIESDLLVSHRGLIVALAAMRLMSSVLFRVSSVDPLTYVAVSVGLIATAALASWVPSRRAASVDPVEALRSE